MNNPWCESCARKNICYTALVRPKCYTHITNTFNDCHRCRHFITKKCRECFGHELFEDAGYTSETTERSK